MIRLILYIILFYLLYKMAKKLFQFLFTPQQNSEVKGRAKNHNKTFYDEEIEDIDYEEVKRKNE